MIRTTRGFFGAVVLAFAVSTGLTWGCGDQQVARIEDKIAGPFDMAFIKKWGDYLVLNSAFDGRYETGSLLRFSFSGGNLTRKQALELPRLGTVFAVDDTESKVAVGFFGDSARVGVFALESDSLSQAAVLILNPDGGSVVTDLDWLDLDWAGQSKEVLAVTLGEEISSNGRIGPVRVRLYEYAQGSLTPLMTLPDDLSGARNDVYSISASNLVYLQTENLLVLFPPRGANGFLEPVPSAYEVLKQGQWIGERDLRTVSALAIDVGLVSSGLSLDRSAAFFPIAVNGDNLGAADLTKPADDPQNEELVFRTEFVSALAAKSRDCSSVAGGKPSDLVLVADRLGQVFGLTGFANLKQELANKGSSSDSLTDHFYPNAVEVSLYSQGSQATGLPKGRFRVTEMKSVDVVGQGECVPVVVRADEKVSLGAQLNVGREDVYVSHVVGRAASEPVVFKTPIRGAIGFAGGSSELLFYSFSRNALFPVTVSLESFSAGAVFEEQDD